MVIKTACCCFVSILPLPWITAALLFVTLELNLCGVPMLSISGPVEGIFATHHIHALCSVESTVQKIDMALPGLEAGHL